MRIDPRNLIAPIVGVLVLVLVFRQTMGALHDSGAWQAEERNVIRRENPYARLDAILAQPARPIPDDLRDPFTQGRASAPTAVATPTRRTGIPSVPPARPPEPSRPLLTAIVWDADPRASIRYNGRDFSVRENSLFADFTVKSIRPTEVVLDRNGQAMVLRLRSKGD